MVIVGAMREARLETALAPGAFVKLGLKHRRQFKTMQADVNELADVREAAEDALEAHGVLMLTYDDDDGGLMTATVINLADRRRVRDTRPAPETFSRLLPRRVPWRAT